MDGFDQSALKAGVAGRGGAPPAGVDTGDGLPGAVGAGGVGMRIGPLGLDEPLQPDRQMATPQYNSGRMKFLGWRIKAF